MQISFLFYSFFMAILSVSTRHLSLSVVNWFQKSGALKETMSFHIAATVYSRASTVLPWGLKRKCCSKAALRDMHYNGGYCTLYEKDC